MRRQVLKKNSPLLSYLPELPEKCRGFGKIFLEIFTYHHFGETFRKFLYYLHPEKHGVAGHDAEKIFLPLTFHLPELSEKWRGDCEKSFEATCPIHIFNRPSDNSSTTYTPVLGGAMWQDFENKFPDAFFSCRKHSNNAVSFIVQSLSSFRSSPILVTYRKSPKTVSFFENIFLHSLFTPYLRGQPARCRWFAEIYCFRFLQTLPWTVLY